MAYLRCVCFFCEKKVIHHQFHQVVVLCPQYIPITDPLPDMIIPSPHTVPEIILLIAVSLNHPMAAPVYHHDININRPSC